MGFLFYFTGEEKIKAEMDSVFVKFEVHKNVGTPLYEKYKIKFIKWGTNTNIYF